MNSKYEKELIERRARVNHICNKCGKKISSGEKYFSEEVKDKFLSSLNRKKFCFGCIKEDNLRNLR